MMMTQENINTHSYSISFCITCYDGDYNLLPEVLNQITNQTDIPDEIVISSSGLSHSKLTHPEQIEIRNTIIPILFVNTEQRKLPGYARNAGGVTSNMNLVMFFDIDDKIHPQKIQFVRQIFSEQNCDMVIHNYTLPPFTEFIVYDKLCEISKITQKDSTCSNLKTDDNSGIHHGHVTIKRSILDNIKYSEDKKSGEDGEFCQKVFDNHCSILYCKYPLIYYNKRINKSS